MSHALRFRAAPLILLAVLMAGCSLSGGGGGQPARRGSLSGRVLDPGGTGIGGAIVRVTGVPAATSGPDGSYRLSSVEAGARVSVGASASGYGGTMKTAPVIPGGDTRVDLVLAQATPTSFAAEAGATVPLPSGGQLRIPPRSLVRRDGTPATGQVTAFVSFIDPRNSAQIVAAPGELAVGAGPGRLPLTSGGMVRVDATDAAGSTLQLAQGTTAELQVPAALLAPTDTVTRQEPRDSIPYTFVYLFDTSTGQWVQVDTAKTTPGSNFITGTVPSLGAWVNLDYLDTRTCVDVRVTTPAGAPRANTYVISFGVTYNGYTSTYTGPDGRATLLARRNSKVRLNSGGQTVLVTTPGTATPCVNAGTLSY